MAWSGIDTNLQYLVLSCRCVSAFCAAEMAGELIRNLSENLPVEGAKTKEWLSRRDSHSMYSYGIVGWRLEIGLENRKSPYGSSP